MGLSGSVCVFLSLSPVDGCGVLERNVAEAGYATASNAEKGMVQPWTGKREHVRRARLGDHPRECGLSVDGDQLTNSPQCAAAATTMQLEGGWGSCPTGNN